MLRFHLPPADHNRIPNGRIQSARYHHTLPNSGIPHSNKTAEPMHKDNPAQPRFGQHIPDVDIFWSLCHNPLQKYKIPPTHTTQNYRIKQVLTIKRLIPVFAPNRKKDNTYQKRCRYKKLNRSQSTGFRFLLCAITATNTYIPTYTPSTISKTTIIAIDGSSEMPVHEF